MDEDFCAVSFCISYRKQKRAKQMTSEDPWAVVEATATGMEVTWFSIVYELGWITVLLLLPVKE